MNSRIQRIELAKLHGYRVFREYKSGEAFISLTCNGDEKLYQQWRRDRYPELTDFEALLPDYLHDLNAMHELEILLDYEQRSKYFTILALYVDGVGTCPGMATAAQRAEAYLKVMGKWGD